MMRSNRSCPMLSSSSQRCSNASATHRTCKALPVHRHQPGKSERYEMERLTLQTLVANDAPNRMLDKYGIECQTVFREKPDGFTLPGHYNVWHVYRRDIPRLIA
jgi:hypothetical protein